MTNQTLNPTSKNITAENIQKLRELFPEIITENKIDFEKLQLILGENIETKQERYNFSWSGKAEAIRLAQSLSTGTLRPCIEQSKDFDTTENLYIEGDNLEVLKLLQKSYHGKIKMIYIDPPYNTGKDFVYPDNFHDNIQNYLELTGQIDADGNKITTNSESNGRYHTDWLNMIYPRLRLARNLLTDDGVIFISIDDNEQANLKKVCDEVFGESNFVNNVIWQKKYSPQNDAKWLSDNHDFILCYAKNKTIWRPQLLPRTDEMNARYHNPDNDPKGPWKLITLHAKSGNNSNFSYTFKNGVTWSPPSGTYPRFGAETLAKYDSENKIWFGSDGKSIPSVKNYLSEVKQGVTPLTIWTYSEVGHNQTAREDVKKCFDGKNPFDTPKPVSLLKRCCYISNLLDTDIILDFFSGSATTAHAVMQLNAEDGGNRKFICVQLPEPTDEKSEAFKAGYENICEIGKERIRRAGEKIKAELQSKQTGQITLGETTPAVDPNSLDVGFRVLKLDNSNIKKWQPKEDDDMEQLLFASISNFVEGRTQLDIVFEIMLKYGLNLTYPIEELEFENKKLYSIAFGNLIICLEEKITKEIARFIVEYKQENEIDKMRVVFMDNGFVDDSTKTNVKEILKQGKIDEFVTI